MSKKGAPGIVERHGRGCRSRDGGRCDCTPALEAWVYARETQQKIRRTFTGRGALVAAKKWRVDALHAQARGTLRAPVRRTLREEAEDWLERAERGEITTRSGKRYKPSVLRTHRSHLVKHVLPTIGGRRVSDINRRDVQALLDELLAGGLSGSTVRNVAGALKVVYRRVLEHDELTVNPTERLRLPPPAGTRDRVAAALELDDLLSALPDDLEALYATAGFAGLRRGEVMGLRWDDVDLDANVINVRRGWDEQAGPVEPKSAKGERRVPLVAPLRRRLIAHKMRTGRDGSALVFGRTATAPFTPTHVRDRALGAWEAVNVKRREEEQAELVAIGLHELRHSYVSLMFAAGFSLEEIGDYVGHSSAYMTDAYRHLLEGHEAKAAERFETYLTAATGARTGAQGA